jgi:spoIIIJ-associated protein
MTFLREGKLDVEPLAAEIDRLLALLVRSMRLQLKYELQRGAPGSAEPALTVHFSGADEDLLLSHNADLLQAIEYLLVRCLHLPTQFHGEVYLDCAGYRAARVEELKMTARVAADRVRESHQPLKLNPMSSRERRIVHLALKDTAGVRTASEGEGDRRQVVIYPAAKT